MSSEETVNRRETAYRLFATEFEDSDVSYAESDEERAPNYVITPTGARVNRLFVVGVLTEVQPVSDDVLRARVVDPTGAFVVYAGQYQPDAQTFLERVEPPAFVAVAGKARTFQPEDSDVVYTSIRPESVNEVDAETRDRWTVRTAERTLERIGTMAAALGSGATGEQLRERLAGQGVSDGLAAGIPLAIDHYETSGPYLEALRETALDALRVVAGEREEVADRSVAPDASGEADLASLAHVELPSPETPETAPEPGAATADSRAGTATGTDAAGETEAAPEDAAGAPDAAAEESAGGESEPSTSEVAEEPAATADGTETSEESATAEGAGTPATAPTSEAAGDESDTEGDELGDFEPGEFDLDEETREEVRSEYGTEFQSGAEVDEPGEADIETPDPEELDEGEPVATDTPTAAETDAGTPTDESSAEVPAGEPAGEETTAETASAADESGDEPAEESGDQPLSHDDVDLEDAVMDAMKDLDDGDGADREQVVATVVDQYGAEPGAVEDAIQDALMDGRCYEPSDETLKPI
ncbi:RPA family protein [Halapricum hydrolyticum]|uniref:Rpa-associated protein n=1 Tax=Halapricum hydrolyticum TaxID=2979991 RepID=A0AAE3IBR3_9EURY|nr:hypothetical protein [Halapricum hydrolyticum]MCU4718636.1 hypothetical protein [Halapricum hydrolyticum]MCU4727678.1 hypothetical protein [Halapricum hydrolyticum]